MGGNATKQYNTIRLDKDTYNKASKLLVNLMNQYLDKPFEIIKAYETKDSFGDLDLLSVNNTDDFEKKLLMHENGKNVFIHGVVSDGGIKSYAISFKIDNPTDPSVLLKDNWTKPFQLDFIHKSAEDFDFARQYFSFNDLGNFIGRIASGAGFKFGFDGLYKKIYFNEDGDVVDVKSLKSQRERQELANGKPESNKKIEVLITKDFEKAIEFLGFDYPRYTQGFKTLEDIFKYVQESKYFHLENFLLDNRKADVRHRDLKRPNYNLMVDYFRQHDNGVDSLPTYPSTLDLYVHFPEAENKIKQAVQDVGNEIKLNKIINKSEIIKVAHNEHNVDFFTFGKNDMIFNVSSKVLEDKQEFLDIKVDKQNFEQIISDGNKHFINIAQTNKILDKIKNKVEDLGIERVLAMKPEEVYSLIYEQLGFDSLDIPKKTRKLKIR
jgi:hypothetical protein